MSRHTKLVPHGRAILRQCHNVTCLLSLPEGQVPMGSCSRVWVVSAVHNILSRPPYWERAFYGQQVEIAFDTRGISVCSVTRQTRFHYYFDYCDMRISIIIIIDKTVQLCWRLGSEHWSISRQSLLDCIWYWGIIARTIGSIADFIAYSGIITDFHTLVGNDVGCVRDWGERTFKRGRRTEEQKKTKNKSSNFERKEKKELQRTNKHEG